MGWDDISTAKLRQKPRTDWVGLICFFSIALSACFWYLSIASFHETCVDDSTIIFSNEFPLKTSAGSLGANIEHNVEGVGLDLIPYSRLSTVLFWHVAVLSFETPADRVTE